MGILSRSDDFDQGLASPKGLLPKKLVRFLSLLLVASSSSLSGGPVAAQGYLDCTSKFKDGSKPTAEDLDWMMQSVREADARGQRDPDQRWGVFYCLKGADLRNADLSEESFARFAQQARLDGADLSGTNLAGADLRNAVLYPITVDERTDFSGANLAGSYLQGSDSSEHTFYRVEHANFTGANLRYFRFRHKTQGVKFADADLTRTQFFRVNLRSVDFSGAAMRGTYILQSDLTGADLRHADLDFAHLKEVDMSGADLTGAYFGKAEFVNVVWNNTTCPDGSSSDADDGDNYSCASNTAVVWKQTKPDEIRASQTINYYLNALRDPDANQQVLNRPITNGMIIDSKGTGITEQVAFIKERGGMTDFSVESVAWARDPENYRPGVYFQYVIGCEYIASDEDCLQRITFKLETIGSRSYRNYWDDFLLAKYETQI
jgi:uncharacterized protein YjbI with pentapeptide repeats